MAPAYLKRLLVKHKLDEIVVTITTNGVFARALPASWHPVVTRRREAAIAALGGSISLKQAEGINEASRLPVARASAPDLDSALENLEVKLKKEVFE